MQLGDMLSTERNILGEPDPTGRFTDIILTDFSNRAAKQVAMEVNFPYSRLRGLTVANQQEYTLPECLKVWRVFVAGQLCVPTDIATMEGDQIEMWDQTSTSTGATSELGVVPIQNQPQWTSQQPVNYPVGNSFMGAPFPGGVPIFPGTRPQWYPFGGGVGLVPPPLNVVSLIVDIVPTPPILANSTDVSTFPDNWRDVLAWRAVAMAMFSDRNPDFYDRAMNEYNMALGQVRAWWEDFNPMKPRRTMFNGGGYRGFYGAPPNNRSGGSDI